MTGKHQHPAYRANAKLIRAQVAAAHRLGERVACWRGGGTIHPGQAYDVGHINPDGGHGRDNLAAEHRHKIDGCCAGNRSHGGTLGAAITNHRPTQEKATTWKL